MKNAEIYTIDENSSLPMYRQLVNTIIDGIEQGILEKGDRIPSLNMICAHNNMSRDTVMMAFNELKTRGIILSRPGKGYFIQNTQVVKTQRIFVLFDELNSFKEDMYNAFIQHLDPNSDVDIYFHHFNFQVFTELIEKAAGNYTNYVIMPATFDNSSSVIDLLPKEKVYILDRQKNDLESYTCIYQDFENDAFEALSENRHFFEKYKKLIMLNPGGKEPAERITGFKRFVEEAGLEYKIIDKLNENVIETHSCFLVSSDRTLVKLIKIAQDKQLRLGEDLGIISFNDTVLKEVVAGGITTIGTDFFQMGTSLAQMIINKSDQSIRNPWKFVKRASV
jgi:DNA-binding transcriptional regulator YhcF (GntR family)